MDKYVQKSGDKRFADREGLDDPHDLLWERHRLISLMIASGASNRKIAAELGVHQQTVSMVRNSPAVRQHTSEIMKQMEAFTLEARAKAMSLVPDAIEVLKDAVKPDPEGSEIEARAKAKLCLDLLKTLGISAPQNVNIAGKIMHGHLNLDQINAFKEQARKTARSAGMVVENEVVVAGCGPSLTEDGVQA